jgi:hypothetical protein
MEPLPELDTPSLHHCLMTTRRVDADEGLDYSSLTCCPAALPEDILPTELRPPTHKPEFIRILEPRLVGHTSSRRKYSSCHIIHIGEWKYCIDNNRIDTYHFIIEKYTLLANALRSQRSGTHVDIVPIAISCTGTPHSLTHTSITTLVNPRIDPPHKPSNTPTRDTTRTISRLHIHFVQWLHHLLRICRITSFTTYKQLHQNL